MANETPDVYYFPTSFFSQKVLLSLGEKGVTLNKKVVNLETFENYSDWYMKLNPKGQVPMIYHNGKYLSDSSAIIKYADETFGGVILMPEALRPQWTHFQTLIESLQIELLTFGAVLDPDVPTADTGFTDKIREDAKAWFFGKPKALRELQERNPDLADVYAAKIRACEATEGQVQDKARVGQELVKVREVLGEVESTLAGHKHEGLCGPDVTVADVCLAVLLQRLKFAGYADKLWAKGQLPMVQAYFDNLHTKKYFLEYCVNI